MITNLIGLDEFETIEDVQKVFGTVGSGCTLVTDTVTGRGKALRMPLGQGSIVSLIPDPVSLRIEGASLHFRALQFSSQPDRRLLVGFSANNTAMVRIWLAEAGRIRIAANGSADVYYPLPLNLDQWYHLEVKVRSSRLIGFVEVKLDGNTIHYAETLTSNSISTTPPALDVIEINFGNNSAGGICDVDNIAMWNEIGPDNNDFLGDGEVQTLFPDADGTIVGWTPNSGSAWQAVDDTSEDGDATFISSTTVGDSASFSVNDLAGSPDKVLAVKVFALARKDGVGDRSIRLGVVSNGVVGEGLATSLSTTYGPIHATFNRNPDGDVLWTPTSVNALEARVSLAV